jgi:hypothetical protein
MLRSTLDAMGVAAHVAFQIVFCSGVPHEEGWNMAYE